MPATSFVIPDGHLDMALPTPDLPDALLAMRQHKGPGFVFPSDAIWALQGVVAPPSAQRPGVIKKLEREGYIVATGRSTVSQSETRRGSPTKEYTFGHRICSESLPQAKSDKQDLFSDAVMAEDGQGLMSSMEIKVNEKGIYPLPHGHQRINYGCPGSGKSFGLEVDASDAHFQIRTVFYPDTTYTDFVGGLKPQSIYRIDAVKPVFVGSSVDVPGEPFIQYVVQAGPLLKAYRLACLHPEKSIVLIIEEISRGAAAGIFGDMMQLLDRHDEGDLSGMSVYEIEPKPDICAWLTFNEIWHAEVGLGRMRFPPNLYLWATMNRADQHAKQLDSAFLRRWDKRYISYLFPGSYDDALVSYGGGVVRWGVLRQAVNELLSSVEGVVEDKLVGPYMLSRRKLADPKYVFEDLWGYIWNDVLKSRAPAFFGGTKTFAQLEDKWGNGEGELIGPLAFSQ